MEFASASRSAQHGAGSRQDRPLSRHIQFSIVMADEANLLPRQIVGVFARGLSLKL
jgi:hypothetical protein